MSSSTETKPKVFTDKQKAVFIMYSLVLKKHGMYAGLVKKPVLYKEVADALFYKNWKSVRMIINIMLRAGYTVDPDSIETKEFMERLNKIERIKQHDTEG